MFIKELSSLSLVEIKIIPSLHNKLRDSNTQK